MCSCVLWSSSIFPQYLLSVKFLKTTLTGITGGVLHVVQEVKLQHDSFTAFHPNSNS